MQWTPEQIHLLRKHLGETQTQFATRLGLKRRHTVMDWEAGREEPGGPVKKLLDYVANDAGFTERVATRLKEKLARESE